MVTRIVYPCVPWKRYTIIQNAKILTGHLDVYWSVEITGHCIKQELSM